MNRTDEELIELSREYAADHGVAIESRLGFGEDGWVLKSDGNTAIKVFYRVKNYCNERNCYERLAEFEVTEIAGFTVPKMIRCDDHRWIVEMGIVTPPRVLDFGKAYLNRPPDYPPESLHDSMEEFRKNYSADDWERVLEVVDELESMQIFYTDLKQGNIQVRDEP